jgi:hypothetical protein
VRRRSRADTPAVARCRLARSPPFDRGRRPCGHHVVIPRRALFRKLPREQPTSSA